MMSQPRCIHRSAGCLLCLSILIISQLSSSRAQDSPVQRNIQLIGSLNGAAAPGLDAGAQDATAQDATAPANYPTEPQNNNNNNAGTTVPDCTAADSATNPDCYGYWPHPKPSPSPPSWWWPSPPPPPGSNPDKGRYTVNIDNFVSDNAECHPTGRRSIAVNVKANVLTLPGVTSTNLNVEVVCTPGTGGEGARYRAIITYEGTPEAKTWLDIAKGRISVCCLWQLVCPAFYSATKQNQRLTDGQLCKMARENGCGGGSGPSSPCPPVRPPPPCPKTPCPTKCSPPPPSKCPTCPVRCPPSGPARCPPSPPAPRIAPPPPCPLVCPVCPCGPPPPNPSPPPPAPPKAPPPPYWQRCTDYLSTTGNNIVVWGDGRDPNPKYTVNPAAQGTCVKDAMQMNIYPKQGQCDVPTSLALEVTGLVFMGCFTYDVLSSTPIVGPEVLIEPVNFVGELKLVQVQFDIVSTVEDCTQVLTLNVQNSKGQTFSIPLPCVPDNTQPYDWPDNTIIYPGNKQRLYFTGMSNMHVMSIRRLYYEITFYL